MIDNCRYCGQKFDRIVYLELDGREVKLCSEDCLIYYYQEYSQENFKTWIVG